MKDDLKRGQILVVSDLTLAAANALWRAAHLADVFGAGVRVLHVVRDTGAAPAAEAALAQLAEAVKSRLGLDVRTEVARGDLVRESVRAAEGASLLVLPARASHGLRERLFGTTTERLARASRIPVLVVRRPLARVRESDVHSQARQALYERVLVSVSLGDAAIGVIEAAAGLSADPRMEVFHALPADRRRGGSSGDAESTAVERARLVLREQIARAAGAAGRAAAAVGVGDAGLAIVGRGRAVGAELLVLGKKQRALCAGFALGAVTQEVLAASHCDVLLVPTGAAAAQAPQPDRPALG